MTGATNSAPTSSVFPVKLHRLLEEASKNGLEDVISWSPDGKSFKVHDKERFAAEIMPSYFGSCKYRSFQKNLNMWAFKAARKGECSHPQFVRGAAGLLNKMKRQLVNRQKLKLQQQQQQQQEADASSSDEEEAQDDAEATEASSTSSRSVTRSSEMLIGGGSKSQSHQTTLLFSHPPKAADAADTPKSSTFPHQSRRSSLATIEVLRRRSSCGSVGSHSAMAAAAAAAAAATSCSAAGRSSAPGSDHTSLPASIGLLSSLLGGGSGSIGMGSNGSGSAVRRPSSLLSPPSLLSYPGADNSSLVGVYPTAASLLGAGAITRSPSIGSSSNGLSLPATSTATNPEAEILALRLLLEEQRNAREREQQESQERQLRTITELAILSELQHLNNALVMSGSRRL